jgi:hypothetical protein
MQTNNQIHIRDPFIYIDKKNQRYLMTGTIIGENLFPMYASNDLAHWERLPNAFEPDASFPYKKEFWAPEIHAWDGAFYIIGSFSNDGGYRGCHILRSDRPEGPYRPISTTRATPPLWQCIDGTLHVEDGVPWIVFGKEWLQCHDGGMWACRLSNDLSQPVGRPIWLFNGSEAAWSCPLYRRNQDGKQAPWYDCYVCEAPWMHRLSDGSLVMLWSGFSDGKYTVGIARSSNGSITGEWVSDAKPIWVGGGHCMLFRNFQDALLISLHQPNDTPMERPLFIPMNTIDAAGKGLSL